MRKSFSRILYFGVSAVIIIAGGFFMLRRIPAPIADPDTLISIPSVLPTKPPYQTTFRVLPVLFISEAPSGNWTGPWKNACEEASIAMVEYYYQGKDAVTIHEAEEYMSMLFDVQDARYGNNLNSDGDQFIYLIRNFSSFDAHVVVNPTIEMIKEQIDAKQPVISMHYGFDLQNPNIPFLRTGTSYHAMVIIGYDDAAREFIVNDDGDHKTGAGYRYDYDLFMNTLHEYDYATKKADGPPTVIFTAPRSI